MVRRDRQHHSPKAEQNRLNRRTFLEITLVGAACLLLNKIDKAAADMRQAVPRGLTNPGKPRITVQALNELAASLQRDPQRAALARQDWRMLVKREYSMTPEQLSALDAIPSSTTIEIQRAINDALVSQGNIVINARRAPSDQKKLAVSITKQPQVHRRSSETGTIGVMQKMTVEGGAKGGTDRETKWNVWIVLESSWDC